MRLMRFSVIPVLLIMQSACQFHVGASPQFPPSPPSLSNASQQPKSPAPLVGPEYLAYTTEVRKQWSNNNYEWLESEAVKLRMNKDRLPGGYWKLRVLYRSIETVVDTESPDEVWKEHIARLENWVKQSPTFVMPRIILAEVWRSYGWKVRGTGFVPTVKQENRAPFEERLQKAYEILSDAATLRQKCPEWYLTKLLVATGQGEDRETFEKLYGDSLAFEPRYYYFYQAKAGYLLPQWYGKSGEWERYAEVDANKVGGEQGDIILFNVYTDRIAHSGLEFMNDHQAIAPRLLAGFRATEKLYGSSPQRLNQACLISFFANDNKIPAELMKRIGNNYDLSVWRDESVFNIFRQEALMRSGELPRYGPPAGQKR
jgi:hypothetical protein